jgi:hypothetical protein
MKKFNLLIFAAPLLFVVLFVNACSYKCANIACTTAPPNLILEIRDNQGRDLLNPATPNHYDTLKIHQLNGNNVRIFPVGYFPPNKDRIKMAVAWLPGDNVSYLKLSDADQDTIRTNFVKTTSNCCASFNLAAFNYNGKAFTDSLASRYFLIVK